MNLTWYALWVKSRHEFVTSHELSRKGIENFLPAAARLRQWKDRKKKVDFPLFPGYLFVRIGSEPGNYLSVVNTRGAVRFVSLEPGHATPVSPDDIACLKRMLASGEPLDVFPGIREGMHVRVKRGALAGVAGVIVKREAGDVFVINFDILGRSVGVNICADDVELA